MDAINMHDAKSRLSALVDAVESGREAEIVIARNGKPAARLVPITAKQKKPIRFGLAAGRYQVPDLDAWNRDDDLIAELFNGGSIMPDDRD